MGASRPITNFVEPGEMYGHWKVLNVGSFNLTPNGHRHRTALCQCTNCGVTQQEVTVSNLRNGASTKCADCAQIVRMVGLVRNSVTRHGSAVGKLVEQAIQEGLAAHASTN
jgi:hypothetical protein